MAKKFVVVIGVFWVGMAFAQVYPGDRSKFIRDVSYPDGSKVKAGQKITKIWEVQNAGSVEWKGRYLSRQGDAKDDFIPTERWTLVPSTKSGEKCQLKLALVRAPSHAARRFFVQRFRDFG